MGLTKTLAGCFLTEGLPYGNARNLILMLHVAHIYNCEWLKSYGYSGRYFIVPFRYSGSVLLL